jgi:hypothetical protein
MLRKSILLVIVIVSFFAVGMAQNSSFGLNFIMGYPQGEFKENVDRLGVGISGQFLYRPDNNFPVSIGLNLGYLNYGSENSRERFSSNYSSLMLDVDRTNNLLNYHVLVQMSPSKGLFRPYLEALLGGSYIFTQTEISNDNYYDEYDYTISSKNDLNDFAWSYGGGGGVSFYLTRLEDENNSQMGIVDLFLDFKVRYLYGSKARYMKEGSMQIVNGTAIYDVYESKTDMLSFQLGVTVYF